MAHRDIVVIGASAGGLHALVELLTPLPVQLPASIFIVVHTSPDGTRLLPQILKQSGASNVDYARDGESIEPSRIYVAPPDHHLLIKRSAVRVVRGPRENRFRPAVDPLFRTAARAYGARVIGIVLSGGLDDGTHGLVLIKRHGGIAIAQDPQHAVMASMPLSAIQNVEVDYILRASDIDAKLPRLIGETVEDDAAFVPGGPDVAEGLQDNLRTGHVPGPPSPVYVSRVRRRAVGARRWQAASISVPRRPRLHWRRAPIGTARGARTYTLGWTASAGGASRTAPAHVAPRREVGRLASAREFERHAKDAGARAATMRRLLLRDDEPGELQLVEPAAARPSAPSVRSVVAGGQQVGE